MKTGQTITVQNSPNSYIKVIITKKIHEGHAGFGGNDSEYDYTDYETKQGFIVREHFFNSGRNEIGIIN